MKNLSLDETIKQMMLAYPSLYRSRVDALRNIFRSSWEWEHGDGKTIVPDALTSEPSALDRLSEDEYAAKRKDPREKAHERLFVRRQVAEEQFVLDNADLLAIENCSKFSFVPTFTLDDANRLPLKTMHPEWLAGLKEFCYDVISYDEKDLIPLTYKYTESYGERYRNDLAAAKKTAREVLARLDVKNPDEERKKKIDELRKLAMEFGLVLVDGASKR